MIARIACFALVLISASCSREAGPVTAERAPATPRRVIAFGPSIVEYLYAMDLEDRIVGVSAYCTWPPEAARHPVMGHAHEPDLEQILRVRPDLILGLGEAVKLKELAARLEVPIQTLPLETLADIVAAPTAIGAMLGTPDAGKALSAEIAAELDAVAAEVAPGRSPAVLIAIGRGDKEIFTTGEGTFLTEVVTLAGGRSVTAALPSRQRASTRTSGAAGRSFC